MTGNQSAFTTFTPKNGGGVTFGDSGTGKIIGQGNIGKDPFTIIEDVLLVEGLKHNLISISQLCDKGYKVTFDKNTCIVENVSNNSTLFIGKRLTNVFIIDLNELEKQNVKCFSAINNESWLWHRRLGHCNTDSIARLSRKELVNGLPKIKFEHNRICDSCSYGKQTKSLLNQKIWFQPLDL